MASEQLATALKHIHRLFDEGSVAGLPDGRLLERFLARRDEVAFAALVERHAALVLAICRRSLNDPGETDDAFQATFIALARRAGSVRDRDSVGGWLYGVARRVCLLANRASARRRRHELRAAEVRAAGGEAGMPRLQDDLGPALYEEIDRLPEPLRLPVVLCLMEGRTKAEAAVRLRWSEGEVRGRLARAKDRLRDRLIRRGLAPAGMVAALAAGRAASGSVPRALIERTARAALSAAAGRATVAGAPSAAAAVLCEGVLRAMLMTRLLLTAAVLLAAGTTAFVVVALAAGRTGDSGRQDMPRAGSAERRDAPPAAAVAAQAGGVAAATGQETRPMTVDGRVLDPDGKPVPGAVVAAARFRRAGIGSYDGTDAQRQELDRAVADGEGRFRLTFEAPDPGSSEDPQSPDLWQHTMIVASAKGFGPAWVAVKRAADEEDRPLTLTLARDDVPIEGRLIDLEGRPVAGASVRVYLLYRAESAEAIDRWRETVAAGPSGGVRPESHYFPIANERGLPGSEPAQPAPVATDADGRFKIHGLGRDRLAGLEFSGPSIAFKRAEVVTRRMGRVEARPLNDPGVQDASYHGADATIVVEPGRPIEGVVRDAETKEPIPGAIVTANSLAGSKMSIEGLIHAVADEQGRYRLLGLPKGNGHRVNVYPPLDRPYFVTDYLEVPAGPGIGPVQFDIELKKGIWITGRVTDAGTGAPVRAAIHYYPFLANKNAEGFPNFKANTLSFAWTGNRHRTEADGRFRVPGLPGRGVLAAKSFDRTYRLGIGVDTIPEKPSRQSMRREGLPTYNQIHPRDFQAIAEVDPPAGAEEYRRDLTLDPGRSLTVRLVDPSGGALKGGRTVGLHSDDLRFVNPRREPLRDDRTRITGLVPDQPRKVIFLQPERKLGAVFDARAEIDRGECTAVLRPLATVTARLVDAEGKPVPGEVSIRLVQAGEAPYADLGLAVSLVGDDGRFRFEELPPGGSYRLEAGDRRASNFSREPARFRSFEMARDLVAEPGQVIDLGTFNTATGRRMDAATGASAESDGSIDGSGARPAKD